MGILPVSVFLYKTEKLISALNKHLFEKLETKLKGFIRNLYRSKIFQNNYLNRKLVIRKMPSFEEKLALKILNELKYNKRMIYIWRNLVTYNGSKKNIYDFLVERIRFIEINQDDVSLKCGSLSLFKKIEMKENEDFNELSDEKEKLNIVSFDREKEIDLKTIRYNDFILINLDMFILSSLWFETVGKLIDKNLTNEVYANRVSTTQNTFFELYFTAYNNYRDAAFKEMNYLTDESQEGVTIQLDIEKCFYHVDIKHLEILVNKLIEENVDNDKMQDYLVYNSKIFGCINQYNKNYDEVGNSCKLPIGFLPSGILANFYLKELDDIFLKELNPISYGRYVDDITIVLKRKIPLDNLESDILELDMRIDHLIEKFNFNKDVELSLNNEKKVFFIINKTSDRNYIKKFKKNTEQLSSDFYRLIDVNELDIEIDAAYEIVEKPIKLNELFEIKKDKKAITKTIAAIFYTLYGEPIKNEESNVILAKRLIKKFDEFIDREMFLEIYDYWLPLILIEYIALGKSMKTR